MGGHHSKQGGSSGRPWRLVTAIAVASVLTMVCAGAADAFVFWADRDSGSIGRAKSNGQGVDQSYIKAHASVYGVAVDDKYVYWTDRTGNAIGRASRNGKNIKRKFVTGGLSSPHGMAVDSNYIYWANSGTDSIGRAALDGSGADPNFITGAQGVSDVSVDSHYVYWTNSGGIGRASLDGTGVDLDFVATLAYGVAIDDQHLYWATFSYSPNRGGVARSSVNGTGIEKKFVSVRKIYPSDVAVDDAHVWWIEQTGIGRSALSGKNVKAHIIKGDNVGHGESGLADMAVDADGTPPKTTIKSGPPQRTRHRSARFRFASSEPDSSFKCKLDKHRWRHCDESHKVKDLDPGDHKLSVRATDRFGNTDPTPAKAEFKVVG
jgi:virginiamycin B lyase